MFSTEKMLDEKNFYIEKILQRDRRLEEKGKSVGGFGARLFALLFCWTKESKKNFWKEKGIGHYRSENLKIIIKKTVKTISGAEFSFFIKEKIVPEDEDIKITDDVIDNIYNYHKVYRLATEVHKQPNHWFNNLQNVKQEFSSILNKIRKNNVLSDEDKGERWQKLSEYAHLDHMMRDEYIKEVSIEAGARAAEWLKGKLIQEKTVTKNGVSSVQINLQTLEEMKNIDRKFQEFIKLKNHFIQEFEVKREGFEQRYNRWLETKNPAIAPVEDVQTVERPAQDFISEKSLAAFVCDELRNDSNKNVFLVAYNNIFQTGRAFEVDIQLLSFISLSRRVQLERLSSVMEKGFTNVPAQFEGVTLLEGYRKVQQLTAQRIFYIKLVQESKVKGCPDRKNKLAERLAVHLASHNFPAEIQTLFDQCFIGWKSGDFAYPADVIALGISDAVGEIKGSSMETKSEGRVLQWVGQKKLDENLHRKIAFRYALHCAKRYFDGKGIDYSQIPPEVYENLKKRSNGWGLPTYWGSKALGQFHKKEELNKQLAEITSLLNILDQKSPLPRLKVKGEGVGPAEGAGGEPAAREITYLQAYFLEHVDRGNQDIPRDKQLELSGAFIGEVGNKLTTEDALKQFNYIFQWCLHKWKDQGYIYPAQVIAKGVVQDWTERMREKMDAKVRSRSNAGSGQYFFSLALAEMGGLGEAIKSGLKKQFLKYYLIDQFSQNENIFSKTILNIIDSNLSGYVPKKGEKFLASVKLNGFKSAVAEKNQQLNAGERINEAVFPFYLLLLPLLFRFFIPNNEFKLLAEFEGERKKLIELVKERFKSDNSIDLSSLEEVFKAEMNTLKAVPFVLSRGTAELSRKINQGTTALSDENLITRFVNQVTQFSGVSISLKFAMSIPLKIFLNAAAKAKSGDKGGDWLADILRGLGELHSIKTKVATTAVKVLPITFLQNFLGDKIGDVLRKQIETLYQGFSTPERLKDKELCMTQIPIIINLVKKTMPFFVKDIDVDKLVLNCLSLDRLIKNPEINGGKFFFELTRDFIVPLFEFLNKNITSKITSFQEEVDRERPYLFDIFNQKDRQ